QNTNGYAGSVTGYNSIVAAPPFNRTELYEYWITQEIEEKLKIRVGKIIPAVDFDHVTRANKLKDSSQNVSSLMSLIYTSIFVNPTLLGVIGAKDRSGGSPCSAREGEERVAKSQFRPPALRRASVSVSQTRSSCLRRMRTRRIAAAPSGVPTTKGWI